MEDMPLDAPASVPAPEAPKEHMLTQIQVNDIVKREKEKIRREMSEERERAIAEAQRSQAPQVDMTQMYEDISNRVLSDLRAKYEAEMEATRNRRIVEDYFSKMQRGPEIYSDFQEVLGDFRPESFPEVAALASEMENTADIMYELAKNPSKLVEINGLAKQDPNWAKKRLMALAQSIDANKRAVAENKAPNAPLSRLSPSNLGGVDAGPMTLADLKKKYRKV